MNVCLWHIAFFCCVAKLVRFWSSADEMLRAAQLWSLTTHSGH